jgi:LPPG:FO 2-phospho-L-lactate transferase
MAFVVNTVKISATSVCIFRQMSTPVYTLSGQNNQETGWGRKNESWQFMDALSQLGGETWFRLGDRDLALHVERTRRLSAGESLTHVTSVLASALGIKNRVLPMCDDEVCTRVLTAAGAMSFQHYFVRDHCARCHRV